MKFVPTDIDGVMLVELESMSDDRGSFARWYCEDEVSSAGLDPVGVQINFSTNERAGTMRGLHWQTPPHGEAKLLRCIRGAVYDVAVDARPGSPTLGQHVGVELSAENQLGIYVPACMAHGYLALTDGASVLYQVGAPHHSGAERGVRWDDPLLGIDWPAPVAQVSDKDRSWDLLDDLAQLAPLDSPTGDL